MSRRIVLIGCVKKKLKPPFGIAAWQYTRPARELYVSPLFRMRMAYADRVADLAFIVSAAYGLLELDEPIAPYDWTLAQMRAGARDAWGHRVVFKLLDAAGSLAGDRIEIHAGRLYVEPLEQRLQRSGAQVETPLANVRGVGNQITWYRRATA